MSNIYFVEIQNDEVGEPYWAISSAQESSQIPPSYHTNFGYRWWGYAMNPGEAMRNARRKRRVDAGEDME